MDAVHPGYLLVLAGVAMTSAGAPRTLAALRRAARADRAEHAALTAAHLVHPFRQVLAIQQGRVLKTAPYLIQQIPVLPGGPQLADQFISSCTATLRLLLLARDHAGQVTK